MTEVPVKVVGNERPGLESIHGREKVNQSITVWTGLVKGIEKDKTLLDMMITAGSPSEAWKLLLSLVGESSEAAQDRVKKGFEELSFEIERESMRDYIAKAKALVLKLEQYDVSTTKKEVNRRILNGLPSEFDVEKKMFLLLTDNDPDELGEALTRVEDSRTKNGGAGGTHALTTGTKPRGGGQGRSGGARRDRGGRGNARGRRDGKGQHIIINNNGLRVPLCSNISNGLHSLPRSNSNGLYSLPRPINNGLRSPPRNSGGRKRISGSHCSGNYSSSRDHQDILADGDHRVFVFVAASPDMSMQNVELYPPHH